MVTTTTQRGQHVLICTCTRTGRHLATFTRWPGSSLYTLTTEPPQVAAFAQVSASGQVAPPCSCRLLSHQTLLWHHRLGHPSLPRLRGMHSRLLVSRLPRSLPPLPPSPAPPCLPCVEGRQRSAPRSSSFPPTTAPLQTLHMDMWGPACVSRQGRERNFLLVVDDYTRYTRVFPLCNKGQVVDVLIPWICAVRLQLRERFRQDLPVLLVHSERGGEFSSDLSRDFCRGEGILQSFKLPDTPQQSGNAEPCIGLVMEVARTSMIHATAPHFLWPFADVTFDESVPFYRLCPYRSTPPPPPLLFLAPGPPPVDPLPPQVLLSQGGAESKGAGSGGVELAGVESEGAEPEGVEPGGAERRGTTSSGAGGTGAAAAADPGGAHTRGTVAAETGSVGGAGAGDSTEPGAAEAGGAGAGGTGAGVAGAGGAGDVGAGAGGTGAGGAGAGGAGGVDPGAGGAGGVDPGAEGGFVGAALRFAFGLLSVCVHACVHGMV
ncbi:unnamed protein product [Closterium sp. NIES-54]